LSTDVGDEPRLTADVDHAADACHRDQQCEHAKQLEHLTAGRVGRALVIPGAARGEIRVLVFSGTPAAIKQFRLVPLVAAGILARRASEDFAHFHVAAP